MSISLITGPANTGKAELVLDAVRRHSAHEQDPLLIVPTRADVEHYLRELAGESVAMGVRVERGRLFMRYDGELKRLGRSDAEQRAVRALDALRERPALWGRTPVLFY